MKIIAQVHKHKFLCEITTDELNSIMGRTLHQYKDDFLVGNEVDINLLIATGKKIKTLNPDVLSATKRKLKDALEIVDQAEQEWSKLDLFDKLRE